MWTFANSYLQIQFSVKFIAPNRPGGKPSRGVQGAKRP